MVVFLHGFLNSDICASLS